MDAGRGRGDSRGIGDLMVAKSQAVASIATQETVAAETVNLSTVTAFLTFLSCASVDFVFHFPLNCPNCDYQAN